MIDAVVPAREGETVVYPFTLRTLAGDPIARADLTALTLTLRRTDGCLAPTDAIVNDRDDQDVLGEGDHGVVVDDLSGAVTWTLATADTTIGDPRRCFARHQGRFDFTTATEVRSHVVAFDIEGG